MHDLNQLRRHLAVLFVLPMFALAACTPVEDAEPEPQQEEPSVMTPYSLSVRVEGATVEDVTTVLAEHIHTVDDAANGMPADWILAGGEHLEEGDSVLDATLKLPGGIRVVEVCNHHYASQAMSFGNHHGVALPCEISISQDGDDVEVILLNPEAIFSLFFQDVPADMAAPMAGMAATVRGELESLIEESLAQKQITSMSEDIGPSFEMADIQELGAREYSIKMEMPIPAEYTTDEESRKEFQELFLDKLIETLTHKGMEQVGATVEGLSVGDWHSAREYPLSLPGGTNVVEMCSPTYATAALSTGDYHAPALPCQLAVWVDGDTLRIHILDPQFIFPVFFADAPEEMMEEMQGMVDAVRSDLQLIVKDAQSKM